MRHILRTHQVHLDWLFDITNTDPGVFSNACVLRTSLRMFSLKVLRWPYYGFVYAKWLHLDRRGLARLKAQKLKKKTACQPPSASIVRKQNTLKGHLDTFFACALVAILALRFCLEKFMVERIFLQRR